MTNWQNAYFVRDSPVNCVGDSGMMLLFGTTFPHDLARTVFDNDHQLLHTTGDKVLVWSVVEFSSCQFGHLAVFNTLCSQITATIIMLSTFCDVVPKNITTV